MHSDVRADTWWYKIVSHIFVGYGMCDIYFHGGIKMSSAFSDLLPPLVTAKLNDCYLNILVITFLNSKRS